MRFGCSALATITLATVLSFLTGGDMLEAQGRRESWKRQSSAWQMIISGICTRCGEIKTSDRAVFVNPIAVLEGKSSHASIVLSDEFAKTATLAVSKPKKIAIARNRRELRYARLVNARRHANLQRKQRQARNDAIKLTKFRDMDDEFAERFRVSSAVYDRP